MRKRDGSLIDYQYDALNRMTVKIVPPRGDLDSTHTRDVYYAYDLRGLQTEARFDSLTGEGVSSRYDGFGRLLQSTLNMDGVARTVRSQYDRNGNRTQLTHPDGQVFTYTYDGLNRPLGIYQGAGTSVMLDLFAYNVQGLVGARTEPNGSGVGYAYDPLGRLTSQTDTFAGGTGNVVRGFDYNPASQIRTGTRDNDAYAWTGHFASTSAYTTNGRNQYTIATPRAYSYDANGNLRTDTASTFVYDIENRLVTATGVRTSTLRYDPLGRLYEVASPTGTTQRFTYDGDALIAVNNGSNGALLERFVHGGNLAGDDPLVWYHVGAVRALHSDHQGSIVAITGSATGAVASINAYDEYGNQNGANVGRFRYTGQAWIEELGLYYYKARMYSPTIGRFMQVDRIGYDDQISLYAYVGNDPVNQVDPSGRCAMVNGQAVGVCPMSGSSSDADIAGFIQGRLGDETSEIRSVDAEAIAARRLIGVRFDDRSFGITTRCNCREEVGAEMVEVGEARRSPIVVTLDPSDIAIVRGRNEGSTETVEYEESMEERAEHAIVGHARDMLRHGSGQESSVRAENEWRRKNDNPFRRIGEGGRVIPRRDRPIEDPLESLQR